MYKSLTFQIIIYDLETIHDSERGNYAEKGHGRPAFHGSNGTWMVGTDGDEKPSKPQETMGFPQISF